MRIELSIPEKLLKEELYMLSRVILMSMAFVLFVAYIANGEERFGMQVYPGAKTDDDTMKVCQMTGLCEKKFFFYRTSDDFNKVVEFYKKQPNLKHAPAPFSNETAPVKTSTFYLKGTLVRILIKSPWTANKDKIGIQNATPEDLENKDVSLRISDEGMTQSK
jgi:hypothetical protein